MNPFYPVVAVRADFRCEYCHAPQSAFNFAFELALSCSSCNGFKSDAITRPDEAELDPVPLFHPRREAWEQHFAFDPELTHIVGLTAVGRVTVTRLKMNSHFQIRARRHWMLLGLYP